MSNVIEHINTDENKEQISIQELQGALKNGFFDKKENVDAIGKELNVIDTNLKNTLVEGYKQYLNNFTVEQFKALSKNQGSAGEKKLFQLASMATLGIITIDNKPLSVDGVIGSQGKTLLNLLYVGVIDIGAEKKQELVSIMSQLTTKLDANNLTLFDALPGNKEYITSLFDKDPVLLSQAIQSCPDMKIFSTNYPFSNYLAEYIATGGQLTSETKLILDQGSKSIKQKEQQQAQQQQFEKRKLQLDTIPGEIIKLEGSLVTTSQELQTQKDAYNIVYKEFCELLKQNNTRYEKAKNIAPLALVVALPGIGRTLTGKTKSSLHTDEQKQLDSYTKLKKSYDVIVTTEKKITTYKTQLETKQQEIQYGYYELVKEFGNQKDADQALVNLVTQYGTQVQKKYPQAISEATTRVSEPQRLVLQANKTQLDVYMKRKETTIDIAQQVLGGGSVRFQSCSQEDIAHLGLGQVKSLLNTEEQNQAIMNAGTIAVRDNTAVAGHRQTTENVMENGNIVGQKTQYHYTDGKTSTAGYEIENQYRLVSEKFKYLTVPGMGTILAKIEPTFYDQLQSVKLEKNQKLIFQPRYNKEFSCFEIDASCVLIGWKDSKGTIGYKSLGQEKMSYIQNSEYQSLLQVKEGYGTLLKQDEKVKQVSDYMANLQQTAGSIQQLANVYAQTPGDKILSQTIIGDMVKAGGLKSQIEGLKGLLSTNGKYQSIIDTIIANKSGVYDRYEHELHGLQEQLTSLTTYTEQLNELLAYSIREGAESRQVRELVIQVAAIATGVLAAVTTGGVGGFLVTTAMSTAAGMAGTRLTQEAFARGTDTRGMTNDLHSDIGRCMNGQEKRSEVLPKVGMEFTQGFATTTIFLGAGRVIGAQLEKFVLANAGTASREVKLAHKVRKSISKLNDSEIQLLEQRGFSQFVKKFGKEFTQEMGEEGAQQGADTIDSRLGGLVSMISCISGKRSYHAGKTEVFIEGFDNQTHTTTVSYIGDVHTIQTDLATTASGAGYMLASSENGMVTYIKITDGVTESLVFKPIQESISIKSLDLREHAKIYGIQHNKTENGEYHYNYSKLQDGNNDLTIYLARNGMVIQGSIHEDGSFTMIDQNGEKIHFTKTNEVKPEQAQKKKPNSISDFQNESEFYRVIVGDDAYQDIIDNNIVRTNAENKLYSKQSTQSTDITNLDVINLGNRPTAFPSFSKGKVSISYAKENPNHYIIVTQDPSLQPSKLGRHGKGSTMFPTDENGNHIKELHGDKVKVYKHIGNDKYELVYEYGKKIDNDYFGKKSRFGFDSKQAREHGAFMDQFTTQVTPEQITQIREEIQAVAQMYTDKTGKSLELTDAQIQIIIATHLKPGELGKLTQVELRSKVQELATVIPDADLRRFLLEAGFCGHMSDVSIDINTTKQQEGVSKNENDVDLGPQNIEGELKTLESEVTLLQDNINQNPDYAEVAKKAIQVLKKFLDFFVHVQKAYKDWAKKTWDLKGNDYKTLLMDRKSEGTRNNTPEMMLKLLSMAKDMSNVISFVAMHGKIDIEMIKDINIMYDTIKYLKLDVYLKQVNNFFQNNKELFDRHFFSYKYNKKVSGEGFNPLTSISFDTPLHSIQSFFIVLSEASFMTKSVLYLNNSIQLKMHDQLKNIERNRLSNHVMNAIQKENISFPSETLDKDIELIHEILQEYIGANRLKFESKVFEIIEKMNYKNINKEFYFEKLDETINEIGNSVRWVDDPYNIQKNLFLPQL